MENKDLLVMLIDDDDANNYLNKIYFNNYNSHINIIEKLNGKEALNYLENSENKMPDIILLDINMPVMNGFEFLEIFEKMSLNITLHMLTSSVNDSDYKKAKSFTKVTNYYNKPINNEVIDEIVNLKK